MPDDSPLAALVLPPFGWVLAALWGALWGSFFNVAIYRLGAAAMADESETWWGAAKAGLSSLRTLFRPPSHCPKCKTPIRWFDNIPVFGWLLLAGKCRTCKAPIAVRYPLIEALSAGIAVAVYARFVAGEPLALSFLLARFFVYYFFCGVLLVLTVIDLETMFLPLAITLPSLPGFFLAGRALNEVSLTDAAIGLGVGFGIFFLLRITWKLVFKREGLGGGDEMLVGMIGGLLGWRALPFVLFLGAMLGTLTVLPILLVKRSRAAKVDQKDRPKVLGVEVPFGPFLAAAGAIYLFFAPSLWRLLNLWLFPEP
jgi:leader peptidase (prepilin peptidase)/N-methyltransferase